MCSTNLSQIQSLFGCGFVCPNNRYLKFCHVLPRYVFLKRPISWLNVLSPTCDASSISAQCKFKDLKSPIVINLDTINGPIFPKLAICDLTGVVVEGNAKSNYEPIHCVKEDGSVLFDDALDDLFGSYYYDEQGNYVHIHLYESMVWDDKNKCWKYVLRENESNLKFNVEFKKIEQQEKQHVLREDEHNLISQFVKATKGTVEKVKRLSLFMKR